MLQVDDLKNILGAVGVDTDVETAKLVVSRLEGKSIEELITEGASGLVSVSDGNHTFPQILFPLCYARPRPD